jgi:hypothetical protein
MEVLVECYPERSGMKEKPSINIREELAKVKCIIDALPRIPNVSSREYAKIRKAYDDIVEISACEGNTRVAASDIVQLFFELKMLIARGDTPPGITGVSAIITTKQPKRADGDDETPAQKEQGGGGFYGFLHEK